MSDSPDQTNRTTSARERRAAERALVVLRKIDALHADPEAWCEGVPARREDGHAVSPVSKSAARWCLVGALNKASRFGTFTYSMARGWLYEAQDDLYPSAPNLLAVNDGAQYGYSAVRAVERRAIEIAEAALEQEAQ